VVSDREAGDYAVDTSPSPRYIPAPCCSTAPCSWTSSRSSVATRSLVLPAEAPREGLPADVDRCRDSRPPCPDPFAFSRPRLVPPSQMGAPRYPARDGLGVGLTSRSMPTSTARRVRSSSTADQLRKLVSGEQYVGWLAVVMFQL
jgi:hypothetical protein